MGIFSGHSVFSLQLSLVELQCQDCTSRHTWFHQLPCLVWNVLKLSWYCMNNQFINYIKGRLSLNGPDGQHVHKLLIYENGYNDSAQSQYAYKLFNCLVIHVDLSLYSKNNGNNKKLCMVEVGTKCSSQECSFLR